MALVLRRLSVLQPVILRSLAGLPRPIVGTVTTKRMKVYTKTGDKGTSQLYSGERRRKDDKVFKALGDTDELNAAMGVAREHLTFQEGKLGERLEIIQSLLFDVGSCIATPHSSASERKLNRVAFHPANVTDLEQWIDEMETELPRLVNFILPVPIAHLHLARTICRRAERRVIGLIEDNEVDRVVGMYLNRLSDFLFVAARYAAMKSGNTEKIWRKTARKEEGCVDSKDENTKNDKE